ncbi:MAG: tRNA (adenosine(37)-N6)-threonylcarbamoyltransferase complex transferase subunit TsaD, partial [Clostridiaceae bacterium]|nr:tRNA (adenosine(37)-N6)-threonylcarbamoyltransferase complex transferase subunit TsaD [Clostridiaceae bacterium]
DAAGEAFDKIARVLDLGYPGGPVIDKQAKDGNPNAVHFPRVKFQDSSYDFSFSGLKTAVINHINHLNQKGEDIPTADICASFQQAVVDVLVDHTVSAAIDHNIKKICLAGGVASNSLLRKTMSQKAKENGMLTLYPPPVLCTDNAAMIASAGYYSFIAGEFADYSLNAMPALSIGSGHRTCE